MLILAVEPIGQKDAIREDNGIPLIYLEFLIICDTGTEKGGVGLPLEWCYITHN